LLDIKELDYFHDWPTHEAAKATVLRYLLHTHRL